MRTLIAALACCGLLAASLQAASAAHQSGTPKPPAAKKPAATKKPTGTKKPAAPGKTAAPKERWITTKSGLKYHDVKVGTGARPKVTDTVRVNYVGKLTNGKVFDASARHGGPIEFPLNGVIKAWTEGVSGMRVGGKRILIAPPNLAYGPSGTSDGTIPPNSTLVFEVDLLGIVK